MVQYCDSLALERNWFNWILASEVPALDLYRESNLLWTKVIGLVKDKSGKIVEKNGKPFPDAMAGKRLHCIALSKPIYFESVNGIINQKLPTPDELSLESNSDIHELDNIFLQYDEIVPKLIGTGYNLERPSNVSWHLMLADIDRMCQGIAIKFNMPSEEETIDLANEALLAVTNKLTKRKLVYTPGLAPVFNLLTTTIYRCMYSIMNKRNSQKYNLSRLLEEVKSGSMHNSQRSFRIPNN